MYIVIYNAHRGPCGGGEHYTYNLAGCLVRLGHTVSLVSKPAIDMKKYLGIDANFGYWNKRIQPDVWISASHFDIAPPLGKTNALLVYFPNRDLAMGAKEYNYALCDSEFTAKWVKEYWQVATKVVYPGINIERFQNPVRTISKHNVVLNVGHFFRETDGHSKNQHILIDAFNKWKYNKDFVLYLVGRAETSSDLMYIADCERMARKGVRIRTDMSYNQLMMLYSRSRFYWHACGYGRADPYQTEHYGIVVAEAMAVGAIPLAHNSGGAKAFMPEFVWDEPEELLEKTDRLIEGSEETKVREEVMRKVQKYSLKAMETELERIFGRA